MSDQSTVQLIYLRALENEDLERTFLWHNDRSLYETLGGPFRYVSRAVEEEWLRRAQAGDTRHVNLAICLAATRQHIGNIYLREIDWIARNAELHIFIADVHERGKGYGQAAVRQMIDYAFRDLGLHRVYLFVLADNHAAISAYTACGLQAEGRLRGHAFKHGLFNDVIVMGLCHETGS